MDYDEGTLYCYRKGTEKSAAEEDEEDEPKRKKRKYRKRTKPVSFIRRIRVRMVSLMYCVV